MALEIEVAPGAYSILRLDAKEAVPGWIDGAPGFCMLVRTPDELTLMVSGEQVPSDFPGKCEAGWRGMFVRGTLDFGMVGVMARLSGVLAEAGVSILAISTFDTDWLFVKGDDLEQTSRSLEAAGYVLFGLG